MAAVHDIARIALRLDVPHETYTAYSAEADRLKKSTEQVMAIQLQRFQYLRIDDRPLVVDSASRDALEAVLSTPLADGAALLAAATRATQISLQGVKLTLAPWQLAELKRRAEKNGTKPQEELQQAVAQIQSLVFNGTGA